MIWNKSKKLAPVIMFYYIIAAIYSTFLTSLSSFSLSLIVRSHAHT